MTHEVYIKQKHTLNMGILGSGHWNELIEHTFVDIMYCPEKEDANGDKIGSLMYITYKQELAIANGINMTDLPTITLKPDKGILFELDYTNISQETIDEIGDSSNLNIVIIFHFGLDTDYRNKTIGAEVIKKFIQHMKGKCGYIIIQRYGPIQYQDTPYLVEDMELDSLEDDPEKAQYKLNAFWQRCGFKLFKDYDNVFICNVDKAVSDDCINKSNSISQ